MKRLLVALSLFGSMAFLSTKVMAGLPWEQTLQSRTSQAIPASGSAAPTTVSYLPTGEWNTSIYGSSSSASGGALTLTFPVVQATMTYTNGATNSTFTARNCLTDITVELSNQSTFYLLDGGTTGYAIYGGAIIDFSGATSAEWVKHWDHLGPWCGTAGNALTLSIPNPSGSSTLNAINADGYSVITGLAAVYNVNQ